MPWRARDFVPHPLRWWADRPHLKRDPLGARLNSLSMAPMLRYVPALFLMVSSGACLAAQAAKPSRQWKTVVHRTDVQVELDTATVAALDHPRRVWLRWTFSTGMPDYTDVQLEQREVDCARPATRILATQDASVFDGKPPTGALVRRDSGAVWVEPSTGSLDAQVLKVICG